MVVVPLTQPEQEVKIERRSASQDCTNWTRLAAGGGLLAGGLLLLTGHRRAGLVTAAGGTVLAMLDQQETVRAWWDALPVYIDGVQRFLTHAEAAVKEVSEQRDRLHQILTKSKPVRTGL
jgi:hypothetical protein